MTTPSAPDPAVGLSIRLVARKTGIAAETLRAWERRYGFPKPDRRPGGGRIYRDHEVAKLDLVARALEAGFRAGEVMALEPDDITRLIESTATRRPSASVTADVPGVVSALLADDVVAVRALLHAGALQLGPLRFVTELAHPLSIRVGELWSAGALEVRHEHLVTACLTTELGALLSAHESDIPASPAVLLATLPGEPHVLPLDMIAVYLAARRAAPWLLGPDTPPDQLVKAARGLNAAAVGLSISGIAAPAVTNAHLRRLASELPRETALWLGGAGASAVLVESRQIVRVSSWAELDAALVQV